MNNTDGNTYTCGLIGNPVKHTMSPLIHNMLAEMTGINLVYVPFEVLKENVGDAVKGARALNILGLNVTVPYKSDVLDSLAEIDELAAKIGAVNTLVQTPDGKGYKGYNTDMTGLYRAMKEDGVEIEGRSVIILGAGGAARSVAFLCASKGAKKVYVLNRTVEKACAIAEEVNKALNCERVIAMPVTDYGKLDGNQKYLCIQCTSVGLFPNIEDTVIEDEEFYKLIDTGFDIIYRPLQTKFMKLSAKAGARTFNGLSMLLYQGIDAFELWNNVHITKEQADKVYDALVKNMQSDKNVVLVGYMGCGKSTVSKELSQRLSAKCLDTDAMIVSMQGRSINDIFEDEGENAFRDMETSLVRNLSSSTGPRTVLSVGGGLPIRSENRRFLRQFGDVVYLKATPETVYDRIKDDDSRPLLKCSDVLGKIKSMQLERDEFYTDAANICVDTDNKTPSQIAEEIIGKLGL
ncbi:MAG: shikimate dehydrogenase [Butyrivibrio sp.]|nr:shikimate dehydrogenase [Butyrivibrio sp.]